MLATTGAFILSGLLLIYCLQKKSPYTLAALFLFALAPLRMDEGNLELSFLVFLGWLFVLYIAVVHASSQQVSLRSFQLVEVKAISRFRFALFAVIVVGLIIVWISQLGITEFSGAHRRERLPFANIVNTIYTALVAYAVMALGIQTSRIALEHKLIAILLLLAVIFGGYLINKRGMAFFPLINIGLFLILTAPTFRRKVWALFLAGIFAIGGILGVIEMTAQRGGGDWQTGIESLQGTLAGETGNGLSPNMEVAVLEYTEQHGPFLPAYTLLSGFYGLIPRAFWDDKPEVGVGPTVGARVFGTGWGIIGLGAGTPVSPAAQVAGIFGVQAYVFGLIMVLLVFIAANLSAKRFPLIVYFILVYSPWLMGSDIGRTQISITVGLVVLALVLRVFALRPIWRRHVTGKSQSLVGGAAYTDARARYE